jgi:hypothetical protein
MIDTISMLHLLEPETIELFWLVLGGKIVVDLCSGLSRRKMVNLSRDEVETSDRE